MHPLAVNIADSPSQQIVLLLVIVGATGVEPLVTTTEFEFPLEQSPTLQIAVYVPSAVTDMVLPVANVDQTIVPPVQAEAFSTTEPFSQIVVGPSMLIVGGVGFSFTSTTTIPAVVQ
ncbi:hypothetical protein EMA8858_04198 [Emticicia aquatica]|uniref:Uncharacterized protein n=1 Tax=Emticicia aquatica TaxID=1681835 RepID=A0ABN8EY65_9BACT|nr:hypothetical protein EMA8858_04198 [Emticicia aquatica]